MILYGLKFKSTDVGTEKADRLEALYSELESTLGDSSILKWNGSQIEVNFDDILIFVIDYAVQDLEGAGEYYFDSKSISADFPEEVKESFLDNEDYYSNVEELANRLDEIYQIVSENSSS